MIPKEIDNDEVIVRGIFHPFHWSNSKKKLKREALLPPSGSRDVSTLRLKYTNEHFCKRHVKKIAEEVPAYTYCGLATFFAGSIEKTNQEAIGKNSNQDIFIELVFSPMDDQKRYRTDFPIYDTDNGLPMHSDILYSQAMPEKGKPQTGFRIIADTLLTKIDMFVDSSPSLDRWTGPSLRY